MRDYLGKDFFRLFSGSYIYVERTLLNGLKRQGVVGVIDLEYYDYEVKPQTRVFATEETVLQRVPPRIALRNIAELEFSHTVMFCEDLDHKLIEPLGEYTGQLETVYDFDLMLNGGHITGYLLTGAIAAQFESLQQSYPTKP